MLNKKNITELVSRATPVFWQIIIEANWNGDVDVTALRLRKALSKHNMNKESFKTIFDQIIDIINDCTDDRIKNGQDSFAPGINCGGDDCHFMDLPAELVSRGPETVNDYLNGGEVKFEARECFSYAIQ